MEKKLKQVMELLNKNEKLAKELFTQETPEGAQKVLKNAGIDFTVDEIKHVGKLINQMQENKGRELSEDELTNVAGGGVWQDVGKGLDTIVNGVAQIAGTVVGTFARVFKGW